MPEQSYQNHLRFYTPHHFVFYPLLFLLFTSSICCGFVYENQRLLWFAVAIVFLLLGWLSFMMRQHYALGNQDRIITLEMRFRYFALTGQRLEVVAPQLSFKQIAALRFAGDEELPSLLERALKEDLSPGAIKKAIAHWQPDHMRV